MTTNFSKFLAHLFEDPFNISLILSIHSGHSHDVALNGVVVRVIRVLLFSSIFLFLSFPKGGIF